MTSFSIVAAAAPVLLALVPCVFSNVMKAPEASFSLVSQPQRDPRLPDADRAPWWKPQALGIDNYS